MRAVTSGLSLRQPRSLSQALRMLRDEPQLTPMAGCTDLFVGLNFGTLDRRHFLNLWALDELRGVTVSEGTLRIGALTTWTVIARSRIVQRRMPMLVAAALEIGAVQIQNRGTIGGNIANGSPAGDSLPVLAAADALVELRSADWVRRVPFTGFYTGYRTSVMRPGELVTAIEIPVVAGAQWFRKVGTRAAQSISKVVVAGVRGDRVRLAFGSVAPTVVRVPRTEDALSSGAGIEEAQRLLQEEIHPIDDIRSSAAYRRHVSANLL
ncbi:MAG: xanthine dehydrogenase family protein subunit M, partial [Vicinamibacterales bacterium]|nr:xanthine dehydrogenase family protein subunit M [Vicinamibacterales bacterium]